MQHWLFLYFSFVSQLYISFVHCSVFFFNCDIRFKYTQIHFDISVFLVIIFLIRFFSSLQESESVTLSEFIEADRAGHIRFQDERRYFKTDVVWRNVGMFILLHTAAIYGFYLGLFFAKWETLVFGKYNYESFVASNSGKDVELPNIYLMFKYFVVCNLTYHCLK